MKFNKVPYDIFRKKNSDTQIQDREYLSREKTGNKVYDVLLLQTSKM